MKADDEDIFVVTKANLSVIAKDKALVVNDSIFAGGLVRDDAYGNPADSSSTVGHATVRVEGVKVEGEGGIYGTDATLSMVGNKQGWMYRPLLNTDGSAATVLTDMTLVNVTAKESILGKDSTLNVHGKVELG